MSKFVVVMHLAACPERNWYTGIPIHAHIRVVTVNAENYNDAVKESGAGDDCERIEVLRVTEEK